MCRCYRDTKMEIQGLSDAPNIHSQHGAPHTAALSPLTPNPRADFRTLSTENGTDGLLDAQQSQQEHSSGPETPPRRLLPQHGGGARTSVCGQQPGGGDPSQSDTTFAHIGLRNVSENELPPPQRSVRSVWKHVVDGGDAAMQMAFPFLTGEEEPSQQLQSPALRQQQLLSPALRQQQLLSPALRRFQSPSLRQQQRTGGSSSPPPASSSPPAAPESLAASLSPKLAEESRVVFTVVQDDGFRRPAGEGRDVLLLWSSTTERDAMSGDPESSAVTPDPVLTEVLYPDPTFSRVTGEAWRKAEGVGSVLNVHRAAGAAAQTQGAVSAQLHGDTIDEQLLLGSLIPTNAGLVDTSDAMDTSSFMSEPSGLQGDASAADSTGVPANETFSGSIMINNQSIIVTIEDGVLTLAAPPEGYVHTDDDMLSLKEHLGMKDHEDIVLLNYDSGSKSIGKISTLAVASSSPHDPRPGLSRADSELALVEDCPLTEAPLDSCPIIKQEVGTLCAITESDLVTPCSKHIHALDGDGSHPSDPRSVHLIRSKKETAVSFGCPQPGCACIFDTRQKLKVHLLNHTEGPRPYRCTVEACGWAFTTSYKLKRHLQSHDKQRPHTCQVPGCGRRFTTVYNLKAHLKVHEQENAFACQVCGERFRSATRLTNHQRVHFEPQRPHRCDFPGCEKTFITFSALFSHNRTHFREAGHFTCSYPGCDKMYDKACRLKIHLRSHTGERPFVCDSEGCGWSFTSMSKLLRHKRKHDDDRRFTCPEEGCGKSFTRAEHLKGHSITHLGTKPFQCHAEGCNAKFSARSSLYIHSKKHKQDSSALRNRCPLADCSKHFSSRSSLKSHMVKHHRLTADVLSQMETTPTLTPSSELVSSAPTTVAGHTGPGTDQLTSLDLSSLFSSVSGGPVAPAGLGVGAPSVGGASAGAFSTADFSLVSSGILTIDPSSVAAALGPAHHGAAVTKTADPLILTATADMAPHRHLAVSGGPVLPPQGTLHLDHVRSVTPEALGTLAALSMQTATVVGGASAKRGLSRPPAASGAFCAEPAAASLAAAPGSDLLAPSASKVVGEGGTGPLLGCVEVLGPQEAAGKGLSQFVFPSPSSSSSSSSFSPQKEPELGAGASPGGFLESGGSARTDYRAIQLAKKKKQKGPAACSTSPGSGQRRTKVCKAGGASASLAPSGGRYGDGAAAAAATGGLTLRDPVTGAQYVQIQLLQDDPASDGDLAFQLSSQPSSSHSQLTVDLPVNILQESSVMPEDDNGSDTSQFAGSTINLQDLE